MKENIKIDKLEVDGATYVREDLIPEVEGTGLYRTIPYCGLNWKVLGEDSEGILLQTENVLSKEIIREIFDSEDYDIDCDVRFSNKDNGWRWSESVIRKVLNSKFLDMLNKDDLVEMTTERWLDGEKDESKDFVRLLSIDEIQRIPKSEKTKDSWYWSFSPRTFIGSYAYVFYVDSNGSLYYYSVNYSGAVAPVIKLKRCVLAEE